MQIIPALGSNGGLRAVLDGLLGLSVSGRPLKAEETAAGLRSAASLRTPSVLVTSRRGESALRVADLAAIYRDSTAAWPDGTPVGLVLRPRSDSDSTLMNELFPGLADALEAARKRPDIPVAATDGDNAEMAVRVPASLTGMTLLQLRTERSGLLLVRLDSVEPSFEALENGRYPHSKTLHLVTPTLASPEAARFVQFLRSAAGSRLLREAGAAMAGAPSPA